MSVPSWVGWRLQTINAYNPSTSGNVGSISTNANLGPMGTGFAFQGSAVTRHMHFPWESAVGTAYAPGGTNYAIMGRLGFPANPNVAARWGFGGGLATGFPTAWIHQDTDGFLAFTTWSNPGPGFITTSSSIPTGEDYRQYIIHRDGDNFDVYMDGDLQNPVIQTTRTSANLVGGFTGWNWTGVNFANVYVAGMVFMDLGGAAPNTLDELIGYRTSGPGADVLVTADGNYTDWRDEAGTGAGDYRDIQITPPNDARYIEASAVNDQSTFTAGDSIVLRQTVHGMKLMARVLRDDATAGANMRFLARKGTTDATYTTYAAPSPDGYVWEKVGTTDPEGNEWDLGDIGEIGAEALT